MESNRILFISQEVEPYVDECPMSLMGRKIPQYVQEHGCEIRTFMPKWGDINERRSQLHEVIRLSGMNLIIDDTDHMLIIKVASIPSARMQVYFIDNDDYFQHRLEVCDTHGREYRDNGERAIFFARGVLETVKKLRWMPDVILCQGWISTLAPLYIKRSYADEPSFRDTRVVFTPTPYDLTLTTRRQFRANLLYKGVSEDFIKKMPAKLTQKDLYYLAIEYSDALVLTSLNDDPELAEHAHKKGIPVLGPVDLSQPDAYEQIALFVDSMRKPAPVVVDD